MEGDRCACGRRTAALLNNAGSGLRHRDFGGGPLGGGLSSITARRAGVSRRWTVPVPGLPTPAGKAAIKKSSKKMPRDLSVNRRNSSDNNKNKKNANKCRTAQVEQPPVHMPLVGSPAFPRTSRCSASSQTALSPDRAPPPQRTADTPAPVGPGPAAQQTRRACPIGPSPESAQGRSRHTPALSLLTGTPAHPSPSPAASLLLPQ
ncbi:hypothetical protein M432DRAFT_636883 [Thermoascus aurantiacus ATCC 26904]